MQTIRDTLAHGALPRPRADLLGGRAPGVVLARGREAAPEPARGEPPHPAPGAGTRRASARARGPPRVSHACRRAAARARGPRPRRVGGGAPGDPAAARCGGRTRPARHRRHHPTRDRRMVPARRRAAARGHGAGQRGGDQAAGGGRARRVGHLRRRRARRAARADADGARAGAAARAPPGHRAPARQAVDAGARRGAGRARRRGRLMTDPTARRRSILWRTRFANLFGAVMAFVYFRFIDPVTSGPGVTWIEIVFSTAAVTALMIIGARFNARWAVPMLTQPGSTEARRRALLFPWAMAGSTLSAWVVAGVIFGVVGPLLAGWFTVLSALRAVIGITAVGGLVTAAIVFFAIENRWRQELPGFFPAGYLSAVLW